MAPGTGPVASVMDPTVRFFAFARERHAVQLRRFHNKQAAPWTVDPILHRYRFTNVFRELDATTLWFKRIVRDPIAEDPLALLATVVFRWFNRITTGETLFAQADVEAPSTFSRFADLVVAGKYSTATKVLRHALAKQPAPHVTGAFVVNTAGLGNGKTKVEGVLLQIEAFARRDWITRAKQMQVPKFGHTMQGTCAWLEESPGMGGFMAYEVACDLRWTSLLRHALDILLWANPGPGAVRGAKRVLGDTEVKRSGPLPDGKDIQGVMQHLLSLSRFSSHWPQRYDGSVAPADVRPGSIEECDKLWPAWEMREVEHTLCEFDKYERTRLGQGKPRGVYQ